VIPKRDEVSVERRMGTASELSVSLPSRGFYESLGYEMLEECSIDAGGTWTSGRQGSH